MPGNIVLPSHAPLGEEAGLLQSRPVPTLAGEGEGAVREVEEAAPLVPEQQGVLAEVLIYQGPPVVERVAGEVGPALGLGLLGAWSAWGQLQLPGVLRPPLCERLVHGWQDNATCMASRFV